MERAPTHRHVRVLAADLVGVEARPVVVEASVHGNTHAPPRVLGLPDAAVREAFHRVQTASRSVGIGTVRGQTVVNLAPAHTRKVGSGFDLAIALALASIAGFVSARELSHSLVVGELGLDGSVRPVTGILPIAELAARLGVDRLVCPHECAPLAAMAAPDIPVFAARDLAEAIEQCSATSTARPVATPTMRSAPERREPDIARVRGQESAQRALLYAAAGGHNILLSGPPGCGKTLLARCLPGLLPALDSAARIEVLRIRTAFELGEPTATADILGHGLRPFRAPHHTTSYAGMIGGGRPVRPGEVTLAHGGVLFLDELPEFGRPALEALRQPLEGGVVHVRRAGESILLPASFQLAAAMNPCPCGNLGHPSLACTDTPRQVDRYRGRISGPLLDRIDLHVHLLPVPAADLMDQQEDSARSPQLRELVQGLHAQQMERNGGVLNRALSAGALRSPAHLQRSARALILKYCSDGRLSARAIIRMLRLGRTIADIAGKERIEEEDVGVAMHYRARF
jgi:magnesium chelatase family protein